MRKMKLVLAALTLLVSFQLAAGVPGANSKQPNEEKSETAVIKMTKADFLAKVMDYENNPTEWVFKGDKPCVIDFYADWCGPCRITSPILEELAQEYKGKINIYKVNVDYEKELSQVFGISGIPAFLYCPMEGKPSMTSGIARDRDQTKQMFKDNIEKLLLNK
ncbi:thioredoxin family protein [Roseimarinus sediminis]|uniref:thioredoxin family protein n=1 Tax=Roseimarinus sediminis TaxID=1610899 RepID=UPI003D1D22A6